MEGEREKHQRVAASHLPPTGDLAHSPGMYPAWELNQRTFGLQSSTQSTEPHQPGLVFALNHYFTIISKFIISKNTALWLFGRMRKYFWAETERIYKPQVFGSQQRYLWYWVLRQRKGLVVSWLQKEQEPHRIISASVFLYKPTRLLVCYNSY